MLVFAHQGGWDEFLYFAIPVVVGFVGLRYAERQAKARAAASRKGERDRPGRRDE